VAKDFQRGKKLIGLKSPPKSLSAGFSFNLKAEFRLARIWLSGQF
jgi:hypothetical protein